MDMTPLFVAEINLVIARVVFTILLRELTLKEKGSYNNIVNMATTLLNVVEIYMVIV
jgi:hypothetical protein